MNYEKKTLFFCWQTERGIIVDRAVDRINLAEFMKKKRNNKKIPKKLVLSMILNTHPKRYSSVLKFQCFSPVDPYLFSTQIKPNVLRIGSWYIFLHNEKWISEENKKKGKERRWIADRHKSSNHVIFNLQAQTITIFIHLLVSVLIIYLYYCYEMFNVLYGNDSSCRLKSIFVLVSWLIDKLIWQRKNEAQCQYEPQPAS